MTEGSPARFYVVGGTMAPGSPSYVTRRADEELYGAVLAGEFGYVLTARQMGKSSLMATTVHRLRDRDVTSAVVDLTQIGGAKSGITPEQWYYGIAHAIQRQLQPGVDSRAWWRERGGLHPPQRLSDLLRDLAHTTRRRIAIFVDEIDATIDLPFSDEFFAGVRACYNARALDPAFGRLTFVLLGVSTPQDLIQDQQQTPFNIGRGIELTDFTLQEALPLAGGLGQPETRAHALLRQVLYWTDGQPYLTQALCRAIGNGAQVHHRSAEDVVNRLVERTYLSENGLRDDHNLKFISARLTAPDGRAQLLETYRKIASGEVVVHDPASLAQAALRLSGVAKTDALGVLRVRNNIYARVFTPEWVTSEQRTQHGRTESLGIGAVVGAYAITRRIGEGGLSSVFLGTQSDSDVPVVIKQYKSWVDRETGLRLQREAQVVSALRHPNIAEVYGYLEHGDTGLLVLEYLPGGSLADVLTREHGIPERQACEWCRDALRGLGFAHQHGIVHRNIKPSNLMLDLAQHVKIIDFGVARIFRGERLTRTGAAVGTPAYMSPEQILSPHDVYHSTDIYSMGVVLYELLTGTLPSEGESEFAIMERITRGAPKPLRAIDPRISHRLEKIVLRALEKDPRRRYGGAEEFARALDAHLEDLLDPADINAHPRWPQRLYRAIQDTMKRR